MKVCPICGVRNDDAQVRCAACDTLLPESVSETDSEQAEFTERKVCAQCGKQYPRTAVRCTCGAFLGVAERRAVEKPLWTLRLQACTGETFTVTKDTIIGRAYQPQIWDVYAPRMAYRVHRKQETYEIENLQTHRRSSLRFGEKYTLGRKTFSIRKEG